MHVVTKIASRKDGRKYTMRIEPSTGRVSILEFGSPITYTRDVAELYAYMIRQESESEKKVREQKEEAARAAMNKARVTPKPPQWTKLP